MSDEKKVLVCMGQPMGTVDVPTVIFGISEAAWKEIEGGRTHDFDLRGVGIPAKVLIFRGKNHAEIIETIQAAAGATDATFEDHRRGKPLNDLGIKAPTKQ